MAWTARIRERLRSSMWFLPALLVAAAVGLAVGMIALDSTLARDALSDWPLLFGAGAEGSRGVLEAIAGSMITVAGVTFSITVVTLSLTSTQYSPRVLRNFMRDRGNQTVLGAFVAIFAYCLVVLRVVRGGQEDGFVPELSVLVGVLLAFLSIGILIYFVHHVATSIQAVSIIGAAARETLEAVERLFPETLGSPTEEEPPEELGPSPPPGTSWQVVPALEGGYLQELDPVVTLRIASERDTLLRMERSIGDYVVAGTPLVSVAGSAPPDEEIVRALNGAFTTNMQRSVAQDPGFGVQQIVDIALKALSPSMNDTTTAVICVDHLGTILARVAQRRIPDPRRKDAEGAVRVLARGPSFRSLLVDAVAQVRRNAAGNVAILLRLLGALEAVASVTRSPGHRRALLQEADLVWEVARRSVDEPKDLEQVRTRHQRMRRTAGAAPSA